MDNLPIIDLTDRRFGKLVVLSRADNHRTPNGRTHVMWNCKCDCGRLTTIKADSLRNGHTKSCGCLHDERCRQIGLKPSANAKHRASHSRLYHVWNGMIQRTTNKNRNRYKDYGGRGITVCPEWRDFTSFQNWAMNNGYDPKAEFGKCTIDRIDNDKGYSPDNCRWVDMKTQSQNKRQQTKGDQPHGSTDRHSAPVEHHPHV